MHSTRVSILLLAFVVGASMALYEKEYAVFRQKHGNPDPITHNDAVRAKIYAVNRARIEKHNEEHDKGIHTYRLADNKFSHMSQAELRKMTPDLTEHANKARSIPKDTNLHIRAPAAPQASTTTTWLGQAGIIVNWANNSKFMTPIKDQGQCGSCFIFSAINSIESRYASQCNKSIPNLSEQFPVDCSDPNRDGCQGGWPSDTMLYIQANNDYESKDYPYSSGQTQTEGTCRRLSKPKIMGLVKSVYKTADTKIATLEAAVREGSVAAAVSTANTDFQYYNKGIYYNSKYANKNLQIDHAINIVGYGKDPTTKKDFWILRNSWGTSWGVQGYMFIQKGVNMCGIEQTPFMFTTAC